MKRAGNLDGYATGKATKSEEDKSEENEERNRTQPEKIPVEQVTGEVDTIFRGGNSCSNESAPPLAPHTLEIPGVAVVIMTQHATMLIVGVNSPMSGTTFAEPTQGADGRSSHAT